MSVLDEIDGAFYVKRTIHEDNRGFFSEVLSKDLIDSRGLEFVQQNQSFSYGGVLRGMHFQTSNPQGKLVTALYGVFLDVIYDLREDSPSFGKGAAIELDWQEGGMIYVPPGCAHGVLALSRYGILNYNCTTFYDGASDGGVNWESPELRSFFPSNISPTVSPKDAKLPYVTTYLKERNDG